MHLWAHIEAYASIVTACLPTLSPLFLNMRSLDSIVGSVRSALSIRSKGSSLFKPSPSDTHSQRSRSSETEKAPWSSKNSDGPRSIVERSTKSDDLESQVHNHEVIMVQKTFVSGSAREVRRGEGSRLWLRLNLYLKSKARCWIPKCFNILCSCGYKVVL